MNLTQMMMTPNETLINILFCIFAFFEAFMFSIFYKNFFNKQISLKKKFLFILSISFIAIIINFFIHNILGDILSIIVNILAVYYIYKENFVKSLIAFFICYILIFLTSLLGQSLMLIFYTIDDIVKIPIYKLLASILCYGMFFLINAILKHKEFIINKLKQIYKHTIIINIIIGILLIFIQTCVFSVYTSMPLYVELIILLPFLLYFLLNIFSLIRTKSLEQTTEDLENEKLYNKTLTLLHDNIRAFKHDFNNIIQSLGGYISLNDMEGLKKYYSSLLKDCKQTNNLNLLNPETINNPSLYSLLTNKYYLAIEKNINMTFDIFSDFSKLNFDIYQLTRILGILLDNAIEAASETEDRCIEISFRTENKKQIFLIKNSIKDSNISTTDIFAKGFSSKENHSGIGLWKVHKILEKNTNLDLYTTIKENKFSQQLEIYFS